MRHPSATPRTPAHHAPCASARLWLDPIHDHGGAHVLQCEHSHVRPLLVHCDRSWRLCVRWRTRCGLGVRDGQEFNLLIWVSPPFQTSRKGNLFNGT